MSVRAVCDTNIVISALLFGGRLAWLRRAWRTGHVVPVVSRATTTELVRVLHYPKFKLDDDDRRELLGEYLPFTDIVTVPKPTPVVPVPDDPDDLMFVELAVTARVDTLVTGDPHLLALAGAIDPEVLTPADLRSRLG